MAQFSRIEIPKANPALLLYDAKMENTAVFFITVCIDYKILTMLHILRERNRGKQVLSPIRIL